ncbi:MAG: hypothetical protein QM813_03425 [Verrucomicrobiota bacterium]
MDSIDDPARAAVRAVLDPADLASQLDFDIDRDFPVRRGRVLRYEPYVGILRGAEGTLRSRAGNSVDKALLLGALLDASLIPHRFASGPLDATTAAAVMASTATDAAGAREHRP